MDIGYIDRSGQFEVLREGAMMTWGIPSPDGHHLAFVDQTLMSNYLLLDRH